MAYRLLCSNVRQPTTVSTAQDFKLITHRVTEVIQSLNSDVDLLKKCHQCMDIIVSAKDRQAAEANKNASILLEEIDMEKSRQETKKAALARKREKRKKKRKEKQKEKEEKEEKEKEQSSKHSSPEPEKGDKSEKQDDDDDDDEDDDEDDEPGPDVQLQPLSSLASVIPRIVSSQSASKMCLNEKNKRQHSPSPISTIVLAPSLSGQTPAGQTPAGQTSTAPTTASSTDKILKATNAKNSKSRNKNRQSRNYDKNNRKQEDKPVKVTLMTCGGDRVPTLTTVTTSSCENSISTVTVKSSVASKMSTTTTTSTTSTKTKGVPSVSTTGIGDLDDFGMLPSKYKLSSKEEKIVKNATERKKSSKYTALDTFDNVAPVPAANPGKVGSHKNKNSVSSPSRVGPKKEDGWKEVVRKSKKVSVPSSAISRVIGRGGANINAIREVTGAHLEVDKQKAGHTGDRSITIKGSAESTRQAHTLITTLIKEPDRDLIEILPKSKTKVAQAALHQQLQQQLQQPVINTFSLPFSAVDSTVKTNHKVPSTSVSDVAQKPSSGIRFTAPSSTQAWTVPTPSHSKHSGKPVNTVVPTCTSLKSPATVSRQLFASEKLVTSVISTTSKTTITFTTSGMHSSRVTMVTSKPTGFATKIQPMSAPSMSHCEHAPLPIKTSSGQMLEPQNPHMSINSGDYSPFNNLFSPDHVLGKKDDSLENRMNFASVAAAGVISSTPHHSLSNVNYEIDPVLQAKAPGYKPNPHNIGNNPSSGLQGHLQGQQDIDQRDNPCFRSNAPPQGHPSISLAQRTLANQLQSIQYSMAQLQLAANMQHLAEMEAQKGPGFGGLPQMSQNSGILSPHSFLPDYPLQTSIKDEYTTPDQPMTLPKIESTLNPNAPDFTSRMNMTNFHQNPAAFYKQNFNPVYVGHNVQSTFNGAQKPHGQPHPGFQRHNMFPHQSEYNNDMSRLGSGTSPFSPLPQKATRSNSKSPILGPSLDDQSQPVSSSQASDRSVVSSPDPSLTESVDSHQFRVPQPIGTERANKKPNTQCSLPMVDAPMWMFGSDMASDWLSSSSALPDSTGSHGITSLHQQLDNRPHSAPVNPGVMSAFMDSASGTEQSLEQALQTPANLIMANMSNTTNSGMLSSGLSSMFPRSTAMTDSADSSLWDSQLWNSSKWSDNPPAM